jgi:hypothetical protein
VAVGGIEIGVQPSLPHPRLPPRGHGKSNGGASPGFPAGLGGIKELHAAFLKVVHRRCRPAGYETGHFLSSAERATNPRVPHPSRAFCEGWDTKNPDTDRRLSHPLQRTQRMGHPPFRGASCRAKHQPRLHREIVSSRKAAHANMAGAAYRKFGSPRLFRPTYASANVGHPQLLRQHRWWCSTGANPLRRQGGQRIFNRGSSPGCNVVPPDLMEL